MSERSVYNNSIRLLMGEKDARLFNILEHVVKWEEETADDQHKNLGFEWYEVGAPAQTLNKLVIMGILRVSYKSSSSTGYRAVNVEEIKEAIEAFKKAEVVEPESPEPPQDLFEIIVGHDDVKDILWRSINSEQPVHILLHGVPASAKSLFMEELHRLSRSKYVLGSGLSRAGLYDVLFDEEPRYLLLDELDKVQDSDNLAVLLSLMQSGWVIETKHGKRRGRIIPCSVYAACNKTDRIPPELMSRLTPLHFKPYTPEEFTEVVVYILTAREGIPEDLALYIANQCVEEFDTKDPRDAVKIARLLRKKNREDVDKVVDILVRRT
jgi:Holliday junction DNA helicase RuvB